MTGLSHHQLNNFMFNKEGSNSATVTAHASWKWQMRKLTGEAFKLPQHWGVLSIAIRNAFIDHPDLRGLRLRIGIASYGA